MKRLWLRLSKREKAVVFFALFLLTLVVARYVVVDPYLARRAWVENQLEIRSQRLQGYNRYVVRSGELKNQLSVLRAKLRDLEPTLFEGDTAQVAASALQEAVRRIASKEGVQIVATRVLTPQTVGSFLKVPIQVEVNGEMDQVASLVKGIDSASKLLVLNEITIRSLRPRARGRRRRAPQPRRGLRATMVIAGFSRPSDSSTLEEASQAR